MNDQATALRGLVEHRQASASLPEDSLPRRARTISIASGKGGVGKSVLALNLAVALARLGKKTCVLDACLGLGSIDLLCGLNGYWNLSHVVMGSRSLADVILEGPEGVHVISGASGLTELADCPDSVQRELLFQMEELERTHDILIVDTSTGIHRMARQFATSADQILVVTVPETTAVADAYATVKALAGPTTPPIDLIVNRVDHSEQGRTIAGRLQQTSKMFLNHPLGYAGHISSDTSVPQSVAKRSPFVIESPTSAAAVDVVQLARRVVSRAGSPASFQSYFSRFHAGQRRAGQDLAQDKPASVNH